MKLLTGGPPSRWKRNTTRLLAGGVVASVVLAPLQGAVAAPTDLSEARAEVLSGSLLTTGLAGVGLAGSGFPSDSGPNGSAINAQLLEAVQVDLGSVRVPLISPVSGAGGLLSLGQAGVLNSYSASPSATKSSASAGAIGADGAIAVSPTSTGDAASLDLTPLVGQVVAGNLVDQLRVDVGALASSADQDGQSVVTDYVVADAQLDVRSPLVAALTTDLAGAVDGLSTSLNSAGAGLSLDLNIVNLANVAVGPVAVSVSGVGSALDAVTDPILSSTRTSPDGLVTVDLQSGQVSVDLDALGLNNQPANTLVLTSANIDRITVAVSEILNGVANEVNQAVVGALSSAQVSVTAGLAVDLPILPDLNGNVTLTGTLASFLGGSGIPAPSIVVNVPGLSTAISTPLVGQLASGLVPLVGTALSNTINAATSGITGLVTGAVTTLSPGLATVLSSAAQLVVNTQPSPGAFGQGSTTVSALSVIVLPQLAGPVALDLATSSVRAAVLAPSIVPSPGRVVAGESTVVDGAGWPPLTLVTVQLTDGSGASVGAALTVTTTPEGTFSLPLPVPSGTVPADDFTITGSTAAGLEATAGLAVIEPNQADNTAVNTADNTAVNGADNTDVNTDVNTAVNTDVNTDVNTAVNGADNTAVNTDVNTAVNGADNTAVNTADNTAVNGADNTDVNTDVNTADNTAVNGADNTAVNTANGEHGCEWCGQHGREHCCECCG